MKQKKILQKTKLLIVLVVSMFVSQSAWSVDIVGYTLATGTNGAATSGEAINFPGLGRLLAPVGLTGTSYSSNGLTGASWDNNGSDGFATNSFSTEGYLATAVVGQIRGTNLGPKNIKAQYSLNGSSWLDVPDHEAYIDDNPEIGVTTSFASFKFRLPAECDNQASVYVRWIQVGTTSINNTTVAASGTISMKSIVMQAELLAAPTSQSTQITIVSLTPTTITLGCTPGSGNRRYIVMNTTNNFTDPTDNFIPTANATYSGSGEQIIFVGSGTVSTVIVPSCLNTYWFRYYEFNKLGELTRFSTIDASGSKNPKMCALPNIHTPTHSFGLIRANMGATIDPVLGDVGDIIDRGVFWDIQAGITNSTPNFVQDGSPSTGAYSVEAEVPRGSTIYYRGYAENESGVILSSEASFNNTPIFTGTGTWETAARWNVQEVPGEYGDATYGSVEDSPKIRGFCTLTSSNNVTNLAVESGKLTINKATTLNVTGTLINTVGNSGILIKSRAVADVDATGGLDPQYANGSLIFANGSPNGSVEMYSKANWNLSNPINNKYKWQFFTIPVKSMTAGNAFNFGNTYVRLWDESVRADLGGIWQQRNDGSTLYQSAGSIMTNANGYEVVQANPITYTFTGALQNTDFVKTLSYHADAAYPGQNIMGNPFTAAVNINEIEFGDAEQAIYQYNTGTYTDWSTIGGATQGAYSSAITPGRYTVSTPNTAGTLGTLREIPSMQGFMVKTTVNGGTFTLPKPALIANSTQQRAKANVALSRVATRIDVVGAKFSDCMWMFSDATCTDGFDNGWDATKIGDLPETTQIYAMESDANYQINAVNNINDRYIGFQPGEDTQFKLVFNHQNLEHNYSKLYLTDLVEKTTVDITSSGSEYSFTGSTTDVVKRFKISATSAISTDLNSSVNNLKVTVYNRNNSIYINNSSGEFGQISIFDTMGHCLYSTSLDKKNQTVLNTDLAKGSYIVMIKTNSERITKSIVIN